MWIIVVWLTGCLTGCTSSSRLNKSYFPINVGDAWVYASDGGDVLFEIANQRDGNTYATRWGGGLPRSSFQLSATDDGVYLLRGGPIGPGTWEVYEPPFRQFAFGTEPGDTWKWVGKLGTKTMSYGGAHLGVERVSVPAGRFNAIHVRETMTSPDGRTGYTEYWLAKDVGVIQVRGKQLDPHNDKATYLDWKLKHYTGLNLSAVSTRVLPGRGSSEIRLGMTRKQVEQVRPPLFRRSGTVFVYPDQMMVLFDQRGEVNVIRWGYCTRRPEPAFNANLSNGLGFGGQLDD